MIHGLALRSVGRDGIAVHELPVVTFENAAMMQYDATIAFDLGDGDKFAIGRSPAILRFCIRFELQAVADGDRGFPLPADRDPRERGKLDVSNLVIPPRIKVAENDTNRQALELTSYIARVRPSDDPFGSY